MSWCWRPGSRTAGWEFPALEELVGSGVFYGASISQAQALAGQKVYIVGGGNSAGQAAMHLSRHCEHVTLVIRSSSLTTSMSAYLIHQIDVVPNIDVTVETEVVDADGDGRLEHLTLRHRGTGLRRKSGGGGAAGDDRRAAAQRVAARLDRA